MPPPRGKGKFSKDRKPRRNQQSLLFRLMAVAGFVRRMAGRLARIRRPYPLPSRRGSQSIITPRSVSSRMRRPTPCLRVIAASGSW